MNKTDPLILYTDASINQWSIDVGTEWNRSFSFLISCWIKRRDGVSWMDGTLCFRQLRQATYSLPDGETICCEWATKTLYILQIRQF